MFRPATAEEERRWRSGRVSRHRSSTSRRRPAQPRVRLADFRGTRERPARLPPVRVHGRLRGGGARPAGEPRVVPQRRDRDRVRLVRHLRGAPGLEAGARRRVHVRVRLLAARRGGAARTASSTRRPARRVRGTFLIDKDGIVIWSLVKESDTRRTEMVPESLEALDAARRDAGALHVEAWGDAGALRGSSACHGVTGPRAATARRAAREELARRTATCSRRTCSARLLARTSRPWEHRRAPRRRSLERASAPSRQSGSATRSAAASPSSSPAREPELVERLVLLDPAILIDPAIALFAAENGRARRVVRSFEEAIERRYDESELHARAAGARRGRASRPPRRRRRRPLALPLQPGSRRRGLRRDGVARRRRSSDVRVPTLLVLGEDSYLPYDHLLDAHRAALGDLLEVVTVPGGHTVLWDALDETAAAIAAFLRGLTLTRARRSRTRRRSRARRRGSRRPPRPPRA